MDEKQKQKKEKKNSLRLTALQIVKRIILYFEVFFLDLN
jgi:hypothetical protein